MIKLTNIYGTVIWINPTHIVSMFRYNDSQRTQITLTHVEKPMPVVETPEEIAKLIVNA